MLFLCFLFFIFFFFQAEDGIRDYKVTGVQTCALPICRMAESDIIIVNHHLFFADMRVKAETENEAGVLPEYDAVVFDEAHELEDVASSYFGITVSNLRFEELARDIETTLRQKKATSPGLLQALARLRERSQFFFGLLPSGQGRLAFDNRQEFLEKNSDDYEALMQTFARLYSELEQLPEKPVEVFNFENRAADLKKELAFIMEADKSNTVFWIERRGESRKGRTAQIPTFLQATPIDVSQ